MKDCRILIKFKQWRLLRRRQASLRPTIIYRPY